MGTVQTIEMTEQEAGQIAVLRSVFGRLLEARRAPELEFDAANIRNQMESARHNCQEFGIDPERLDWTRAGRLSVRNLRTRLRDLYESGRLREATAESSFGQLLRYGVSRFLFDAYQMTTVAYPALYTSEPSDNLYGLYAPLYGAEIPEVVEPGGDFAESRTVGIDVTLKNYKVGRMLAIERELVDDDQTGQIRDRASKLGEKMRYREEIDALNAWINAKDYAPGSAGFAGFTTAIGNKFASNQSLTMYWLEQASILLRTIKDPLGNIIVVTPDTVLASATNEIGLYKLLNSAYQPAVPGLPGETLSTATAGSTGYVMAENWLKGKYAPVIAPLLADSRVNGGVDATGYWYLTQAKKGAVLQERDPLEVAQENPLSGMAFQNDAYRYRVRRRYAFGVIEPRFTFQGNGAQ